MAIPINNCAGAPVKYGLMRKIAIISAIILLFLIIGYDNAHHWDENNHVYKAAYEDFSLPLEWCSAQTGGVFDYWYVNKIVHLFIAHWLIGLIGIGITQLFLLDLSFAFFMLLYFLGGYFVLSKIFFDRESAIITTIILMFLPVNLYLAYKVLSEVNALLFVIFSIYCFQKSFDYPHRLKQLSLLFISALLMMLSTISRLDSVVLGFGYPVALLIASPKNFREIIPRTIYWVLFYILILGIYNFITGIQPFGYVILGGPLNYANPEKGMIKKLILSGSFFNILILLSFIDLKSVRFRFAFSWLLIVLVPLLIFNERMELRYLYLTGLPVAILSFIGIKVLYRFLSRFSKRIRLLPVFIIIMLICLACNYVVDPFFDVGVYGNKLNQVINKISDYYKNPLILVRVGPNMFSYLRFCYPQKNIGMIRSCDDNFGLPEEIYINNKQDLKKWSKNGIVYIEYGNQKPISWVLNIYYKLLGMQPGTKKSKNRLARFFYKHDIKYTKLFDLDIYRCFELQADEK